MTESLSTVLYDFVKVILYFFIGFMVGRMIGRSQYK